MNEEINRGSVMRSRRQILVTSTAGITALGLGSLHGMGTEDSVARSAEWIHQEPIFKASPKRVYEALTDAKTIREGDPTKCSGAIWHGVRKRTYAD